MFTIIQIILIEGTKGLLKRILGRRHGLFLHPQRRLLFSFPSQHTVQKIQQTNEAKVSVVIPTLNGEETIKPLLQSLIEQQKVDIVEIILVDSGSSDKTISIAEQFPKVKVIHNPMKVFNHGLARNLGAEKVRGQFIFFTVQDALFEDPLLLADLSSLLVLDQSCAAASAMQKIKHDADLFTIYENTTLYEALTQWNGYRITKKDLPIPGKLSEQRDVLFLDDVAALYRKDIFTSLQGFRAVEHAEDLDFAKRAVSQSFTLGFVSKKMVTHSHTRPFAYILKRNYVGHKVAFQQFNHKNHADFSNVLTQIQVCLSILWSIHKLASPPHWFLQLFQNKKIVSTQKLPQEFIFFEKILDVLKVNVSPKFLAFYQYYRSQLLRAYIRVLIMDHKQHQFQTKEIQTFLKKELAALCGENLAIALEDQVSQNGNQPWILSLDNILKNNV
jgi:rhamnosyltransferase